jgi:hypothetical protein
VAAEFRRNGVRLEELVDAQGRMQRGQLGPGVGHDRHPHATPPQFPQRGQDFWKGLQDRPWIDRTGQLSK